jgi:uncharacterized membrane protein YkvA (DUF1232 family)
MSLLTRLRRRARLLKADSYALYLAARHPGTPWYAKLLLAAVVAYALSPIDLIPDFIPLLGYVDDLVLLPLGIALAIRLIPPPVLADCRARAAGATTRLAQASRLARLAVIGFWLLVAALLGWLVYREWAPGG